MNKVLRDDMTANFKAVIQDQKETIDVFKKTILSNNVKVVYIAGQVTGLPYKEVYDKFRTRQLELETQGYIVINPCVLIRQDEDWATAMKQCLYVLQFANYINLLPDWMHSRGARIEFDFAKSLNIPVLKFNLD